MGAVKHEMMKIADVLESFGPWAHDGDPDETAMEWLATGFVADDVYDWLEECRCYVPAVARALANAGQQSHHLAERLCEAYGRSAGVRLMIGSFNRLSGRLRG